MKYIEIGKLAINEVNIAFHERLLIAKKREESVKRIEKAINIENNISILKTSCL